MTNAGVAGLLAMFSESCVRFWGFVSSELDRLTLQFSYQINVKVVSAIDRQVVIHVNTGL